MPKTVHRPENVVLTQHLRAARLAAGLHQTDVAALLERTQSFVSDVENGSRRLDLIELRDVCRVLEVDFLEFVTDVERAILALPLPQGAKRTKAMSNQRSRTKS